MILMSNRGSGFPFSGAFRRAIASTAILLAGLALPSAGHAQQPKWISAYYSGWWQGTRLNPDEIDFGAVTCIIHFALVVSPDGTCAGEGNGITPANAASTVRAVHAAGKKVLVSVGGANSEASFSGAVSSAHREAFISRLLEFTRKYGYDGIDVDWEPVQDVQSYLAFVRELRQGLPSSSLLVTAVMTGTDKAVIAEVAPYVDQVNLMTYDMAGAWPGWVTWHNSPLYDGGAVFQSTGGLLPSIDQVVRDKLAGGVPASKLGIGIDFYGYVWRGGDGTSTGGVTRPVQSWKTDPDVKANIPYFQIMESYYRSKAAWDSSAQASYISIDNPGSAQDEFVSFDNERSIRAKSEYVQKMGLGGVIIYDLGAGYRRTLPKGYRDLLLQSVRYGLAGGKKPLSDDVPPSLVILSPNRYAKISGTALISAEAADNTAVACVEFRIDGRMAAPLVSAPPYSVSVNTWRYGNGAHVVDVVAFDAFGNSTSVRCPVTVRNDGIMPPVPERIVYDDSLHAPFINASWGAAVRFDSRDIARTGFQSAAVEYQVWGAFDILSGSWQVESPLDPVQFDTLRADIYAFVPMRLKIGFYNNYSVEVSLRGGEWNAVAVPLDFAHSFSRFYFQSLLDRPARCYFDNIRFTPANFRLTSTR